MASISSPGIGSGLDVNSIISQMMAIERTPITNLQTQASQIQAQISEYGKLQSATSALRDAALKLASNDTWGQTTGTSSNPTAVGVTVKSGAATGDFTLEVQSLAMSQSLASGVFSTPADAVGSGTLHIELGTWGSGQTSFTPKSGATAVDIAIADGDTLAQVRDKINTAGAGVTAMVLTDATGSRLLLRSTATGADSAFRTSVTDGDGNDADGAGLSAFAFDPSSSSAVMTQTQAAANASATLNGLAITSASNTLTDIVDGVSLTLNSTTTGPVSIGVRQDNDALKKNVQSFVDAYNAYAKLIGSELKYDSATKTAGPLQGDSSAVGMQRQMRALVGASSGASNVFSRISDVGLELQRDGTLSINSGKLDAALANLPEMKKLFANTDATVPANNGIACQFRQLGDLLLGSGGTLTTRTEGLQKQITLNQTQQDTLERRAEQTETRLRAQYTALDVTLGQLSGMSAYVTQQIASWNATQKS